MTEQLKIGARGEVSIYTINDEGEQHLLTRSNTILGNAHYLLSRMLMQDRAADITHIRLYNGATLLSAGLITNRQYVDPNEVRYECVFSNQSFNGTVTVARLGCMDAPLMGNFAELTGLNIIKDNIHQLLITWNIKLI